MGPWVGGAEPEGFPELLLLLGELRMGWAPVHPAPSFLLPYILCHGIWSRSLTRGWESGRQIQSWAVVDFGDL